ncbi:unnamed protein product [Discosporangium mesarthrocarpum]
MSTSTHGVKSASTQTYLREKTGFLMRRFSRAFAIFFWIAFALRCQRGRPFFMQGQPAVRRLMITRMGLGEDVDHALRRYYGEGAPRVLDAWARLRKGEEFKRDWEGKGLQCARSFVEGLCAEPWHDAGDHVWAQALEEKAAQITGEFRKWNSSRHELWKGATGEDILAYGDNWRKVVLQDRIWDPITSRCFPETTKIIKALPLPSCEVCFASQGPSSGIGLHTDNTNFFLTAHLGIDIPEGECWIQVGETKKEWCNGKVMVFDASFMHKTRNESNRPRIVLLIRFWHPEVTPVERNALEFVFAALDDPSLLKTGPPPNPAKLLGDAAEEKRLDGFLEELKAEGLVQGYSTPEDVLSRAPANREGRRIASKVRKKAARKSGRQGGFGN